MPCRNSLLAATALLLAPPVLAQEPAVPIDIPKSRLAEAIRRLGDQSGVSVGFHDASLQGLKVKAVRGRYTPEQALDAMLRESGARARRVAPGAWLVEKAPRAPVTVPPPAAAAPPPPEPEILVTGTKRAVPIGFYPGGIQIIDGERLTIADGARGSDAIEARAASVATTHLGPGRNKLFIRGVADSSFVGPTQATVGQYWGNSRISYSAPDPSLRLYDVGRIEVLEGPQGTLYGAGSLGGVVRVVPREPDLRSTGGTAWVGAQTVAHGQPGGDAGAILNLPLSEGRLALRALAFGAIDGGYIDDKGRDLKDVNEVRTYGGRAALRFEPGDGWSVNLSAVGQHIAGADSQYAERDGDGLSRSSRHAQPHGNDFWLADLVVRKQWDELELTSSFGYARQNVFERFEGPPLVVVAASDSTKAALADPELEPSREAMAARFSQRDRISMLSAETRLSRRGPNGTGWLIGASLLHNVAAVSRQMQTDMMRLPLTGVHNKVDEYTLYGDAAFEPAADLVLTFGGRLAHARLSGQSRDTLPVMALRMDPEAASSRTETRFLPSFAAAWRPANDLTLFARYQQGFRPGGIVVRRDFIQRFDGDRLQSIEGGARYGDERLDISVSLSWTRWHDIQADLVDGFGFPTTFNIGDGRVRSVGFFAGWRPLPGLELDAALYLNDSHVTSYVSALSGAETAVPQDFDRLPNVADATGRLGFSYQTAMTASLDFAASGYGRYVGKSTLGVGPILGQLQGNYLDTGLEFRISGERHALSLSVTNILDSRGNRFALGSPFLVRDHNQITPLQPRRIRLGLETSF
ncbi:TonB-dependent receptor [Sandaracinobacter sp. RS1-74]|uniref:TonB-dependent receptor domain-containing protein n=1 Tax=Sandaracinobacteroides sayramensis TaxID=2913411 RepID=UPI001EDC4716|nr:TonB-dependent receptor [Sandaracinobacteroides sayramensis]MCG2840515.1 TonB-dependent receptor [Sandaracinobacteroides sayramensis]